ncbi:type I restriction-modification system methyltransferase subunit [Mycobacteroides abscessus subsp. massiliense]|uniref:N-6 DNA methylase n=1 Tax=Mycobacteroides abscessus TaxID=36809 RepID=UPI0009A5E43C|nr:N-6 DNA methylase [Mycobacteroides abscessus]SKY24380.1 type I restriction-modification system methyltransferase subunit [Mycobacteroides abscessus subsp. massiliense]SKY66075.1 type I restriction-modification system methyltransferase subunit [Mycobacteroides abscessus subsp. massiliense]
MPTELETETVARLARRKPIRPEAETQADIYMLLTTSGLGLGAGDVVKMESQVADGTRRRIDIEAGHVVIEVKKDLRIGNLADFESQLAGYVKQRHTELGSRYVGILTDGTTWRLYNLAGDDLLLVSELVLSPSSPDPEKLLIWLESVMATREKITPTPQEIENRLGADSPGHHLDHASLTALYEANMVDPEVKLKRELWAKLLRTAFGTDFVDDPDLFINHTLLVVIAELVAHAAVGFDVSPHSGLTPVQLTSGSVFQNSQIHGVVEADFFDWVVQVDGGEQFVAELGRRIARFDWSKVEHDVLKVLYQSVIPAAERSQLGEYYTPDWLADRIVDATVKDGALTTRVADPSCGSGTFVFHAVRRFLTTAEAAGVDTAEAVAGVTSYVVGIDVHPVAVTLARVTYLLAIGLDRLNHEKRGPLAIPVYLGDSMQWEQSRDLIGGVDNVTIHTAGEDLIPGGGGVLFGDDLVFPRSILGDAGRFDRLVSEMADKALDVSGALDRTLIDPVLKRFGVTAAEGETLRTTFSTMRALHRSGKDHIWGYYVRNLIRPLWLSEEANRVDLLVGNPPWLRYSKMSAAMQERYKVLAKSRNLLTGGLGASSRDLSTLFVVRAVEQYLKAGGSFGFVMPHGILTRKPHTGFRSGAWMIKKSEHLAVQFETSWDLVDASTATGFPNHACVVFGHRAVSEEAMKDDVIRWSGRLARADVPWKVASKKLSSGAGTVAVLNAGANMPASPYKELFRQGAVLAPRMTMFVTEVSAGPLGAGAGRVAVTSQRTSLDKAPWKDQPSINATVETSFVKPVYLGETVLPFRTLEPRRAVLPLAKDVLLDSVQIDLHPGLASWWNRAETIWDDNKSASDDGSLLDRIDFLHQLSAQMPVAPIRVVYPKAGNTLPAAVIRDATAIIDHKLYWAPVPTESEANYICAVINSARLFNFVKPLQALGLLQGRDWDKNIFAFPFPRYDDTDSLHLDLTALGAQAATIAAGVDVSGARTFQAARSLVVRELVLSGVSAKIELAVAALVLQQ